MEQEKDQQIALREEKIDELEQALAAEKLAKPTVEDTIRELIQKEMDEKFVAHLTQAFQQAAKALAPNTADPTKDENGSYAAMFHAMLEMVVAESFAQHPTLEDCTPAEYAEAAKYFKTDVRNIINHNIDDISNDVGHRSNMYKHLG